MRAPYRSFTWSSAAPGPGSPGHARCLEQAHALGVDVRFGSRLERLEGSGILTVGPKAADAIAVGYHFETDMDDGFWVILRRDPRAAGLRLPAGDERTWHGEELHVRRVQAGTRATSNATVDAFERLVGLKMRNPRRTVESAISASRRRRWSDSIRWRASRRASRTRCSASACGLALRSGVFAARVPRWTAATTRRAGAASWSRAARLAGQSRALRRAGQPRLPLGAAPAGRARCARSAAAALPPSFAKRLLMPWARWRYRSRRRDASCNHIDCECVWCRHAVPR